MAKRKSKPKKEPSIDELVDLAEKVGLPAGAFDGDLEDACDDEAEMMKEGIKGESLSEQLQFLYLHGFSMTRLAEMITELSSSPPEGNEETK